MGLWPTGWEPLAASSASAEELGSAALTLKRVVRTVLQNIEKMLSTCLKYIPCNGS